jgi:hypothetical protein
MESYLEQLKPEVEDAEPEKEGVREDQTNLTKE